MKTLRFVMYILYRYYSKGATFKIPYFSALTATVFYIYIHIMQGLIAIDKMDELFPIGKEDSQIAKYWKLALFLLPIYLAIGYLVKSEDLKKLEYSKQAVKRGGIYLVIYGIASFIFLFVLIFIKR